MNHVEKGSYVIGETVINEGDNWNNVHITFEDE